MHVIEARELDGLWEGFENDFSQLFRHCLDQNGLENALGLVHKFKSTAQVLSQAQYSSILSQLP